MTISSGDSSAGVSGAIDVTAGSSGSGNGGAISMTSGSTGSGTGGVMSLTAGAGSTAAGILALFDGYSNAADSEDVTLKIVNTGTAGVSGTLQVPVA